MTALVGIGDVFYESWGYDQTNIDFAQAPFPTTATDEEALVYLYTTSLATPLSHETYNLYIYLFGKFFPEQAKALGNEVKELSITEKQIVPPREEDEQEDEDDEDD